MALSSFHAPVAFRRRPRNCFFSVGPNTHSSAAPHYDCLPVAVPKPLADFGAVLTRAVVTENTLELADGTFFLGEPRLRSKLYIRPCYKYLSKLILEGVINGMTDKIVVTGTPGIGKSEFGFYLMHLLRCRGKTVVLERKGAWYRFSDEGVTQGYHVDFGRAGYLQDTNTWFLSDPEDKPKEILGLPTVVLVSPRTSRVNEFMKQPDSFRFYMPVWSLEELFECQRAVFPHVPETDVRERFGKVGGVARAVFHANRLEELCAKMQTAASNMDLNLMQQILSRRRGDPDQLSTDKSGDTLLHMTVVPETDFKEFKVDFASEYAHNLTLAEIPKKEFAVLASFVRSAFANDELGTKVGAHRAEAFEILAHETIGGAGKQQGFDMRILSSANSSTESVLEGDDWMFSFSEQKSFEGKSLPDTVVTGTYYRPLIQNFPAIDSFGVDSGSKTLWLFQMKSAGLPPRTGGKAVKWNYVEENWSSAKLAHGVPIKNCVFAFVVPEGKVWNKAIKTSEKDVGCCGDWLLNVTDGFKSACDVCVIKIPL